MPIYDLQGSTSKILLEMEMEAMVENKMSE
jgi:hypothetical protein